MGQSRDNRVVARWGRTRQNGRPPTSLSDGGPMPALTTRRRLRNLALTAGAAALVTAAIAGPAGATPSSHSGNHARTTLPKQIVPARGSHAAPRAVDKAARPSGKA